MGERTEWGGHIYGHGVWPLACRWELLSLSQKRTDRCCFLVPERLGRRLSMQRQSPAFILLCPIRSRMSATSTSRPRAHPHHAQRAPEHHRLRLLQAQCPRRARRSVRLPPQDLGGRRRKQEAPLYPLVPYVITRPAFLIPSLLCRS